MGNVMLDRIDFDIIRLLQRNARLSNKQVAAAVKLAPSTCHERIKNLQASGVIRGAHAEVDMRAIGLSLEVLAFIKLANYERSAINKFMDDMASIPEVRRVFLVNGRYDVVVLMTVKDIDHLRNLGFDRITSLSMVVNIETAIVYDSRARNELPIAGEVDQSPKKSARLRRRAKASSHMAG
jgi:DNA-binding Lrp family transcriptional regulator